MEGQVIQMKPKQKTIVSRLAKLQITAFKITKTIMLTIKLFIGHKYFKIWSPPNIKFCLHSSSLV